MPHILLDALQQTFIFIPLTLGIYLSYQLLKITDLTPDGTFVLGAAIFWCGHFLVRSLSKMTAPKLAAHIWPHTCAAIFGTCAATFMHLK